VYSESGTYVFSSGILHFTIEKKIKRDYGKKKKINLLNDPDELSKASTMIPFKWSDRIYLLDEGDWEFLKFCNAINLGLEPRKKLYGGDFLLRNGDEKKAIVGNPPLPEKWSSYLLSQPVTAMIIKIVEEGSRKEDRVVLIDKGSKDGLKVGMILSEEIHVADEEPTFFSDPTAISLEDYKARVRISLYSKLKAGDKITTRFNPGPFFQYSITK
jgi:hypothetical protein